MTIGIFIDEYLPKLHGPVTSTLAYKKALEDLGHTVYIVAPSEPGYEDTITHVIRVHSFDPKLLKSEARLAVLYPGLARKLGHYRFDVVHSQTQFGMGLLASEVARTLHVPHVTTMHTIYAELLEHYQVDAYLGFILASVVYPIYFRSRPNFSRYGGKEREKQPRMKQQIWHLSNLFLNKADAVIAPSRHIAKTLKDYGLKQRCYILPNGVDVKRLQALGRQPLPVDIPDKGSDIWVVCVSRLSAEKRQRALIEAMAQVSDQRVKLVLVGTGPSEAELRDYVAETGQGDRIYLLGKREPAIIPSIMQRSDMFVLASYRFDNQPMVILEALAAGLPLIYCDDKLTEGLSPENALLTKDPSPAAIAEAINTLARDTAKRQAMAAASRTMSQSFDIAVLAKKLESIYAATIIARSKKPSRKWPFARSTSQVVHV